MPRWRNTGAPFPGPDGTVERGGTFEADEDDTVVRMRRHKLERLPGGVEDYAVGGGWYEIPGAGKVQGREAAEDALAQRGEA